MGFFLITLDISIVNVALSSIRHDLGGGTVTQQWVIDGYTLLFASLLLFAGTVSDRIGARKALGIGIAVFGVASLGCGAAPTAAALIAARCVQGAGAAVMLPASMALIREAFPDPARRARALGVWAVGGAVAGLIGQPLGGLLTTVDWRWVFGINIPVCIAMLALLGVVAPSPRRPQHFDWPGQVLAVIALTALVYGLIEGGHAGFATGSGRRRAHRRRAGPRRVRRRPGAGRGHPMMPLELFQARGFRLALPVGFAFMVGNYGNVFVISLYLQQHLGLTPLHAGLVFLPSAFFAIAGNLTSGPVTNRFGPRVPVVLGQLSMVVGLVALLATATLRSPVITALCVIPVGAGGSLAMPAVTGVVLDGVTRAGRHRQRGVQHLPPGRRRGRHRRLRRPDRQPAPFLPGMRISLATAAALLVLTALTSLAIRRRTSS